MCTSVIYTAGDYYFGRNLDLEVNLGQEVVITPRNKTFRIPGKCPILNTIMQLLECPLFVTTIHYILMG